jgi:hypothetical protein
MILDEEFRRRYTFPAARPGADAYDELATLVLEGVRAVA